MKHEASTSRWIVASFVALWLHAGLVLLLAWLQPFSPGDVNARERPPVELVFAPVPEPPAPEASEDPEFFSELPEDRADIAPERADFLSNVDSRARDRADTGEGSSLPRMDGEGDSPQVAMDPTPEAPPAAGQPEPGEAAEPVEEAPAEDGAELGQEPAPADPRPRSPATGDPTRELRQPARPAPVDPVRVLQGAGSQDIFQEEMLNPTGNALFFGNVSLNTLAWDYAPWLQRFKRRFVRNWIAPYAYHLGLIHGEDLVELEVAPNGRMVRLELLSSDGHESLGQASMAAFQALAPLEPLPGDFPEETLVLRVRLIYPDRRR